MRQRLDAAVHERPSGATPIGHRALRAFRGDDLTMEDVLRWLWFASAAAGDLWDDEMPDGC
jgi:hypothetical protein